MWWLLPDLHTDCKAGLCTKVALECFTGTAWSRGGAGMQAQHLSCISLYQLRGGCARSASGCLPHTCWCTSAAKTGAAGRRLAASDMRLVSPGTPAASCAAPALGSTSALAPGTCCHWPGC